MSPLDLPPDADNPFDARRLRPGAIDFSWPTGKGPDDLVARLKKNGWRGQIVGPHGSGKSALVAALIEPIEQCKRNVVLIELHDGQRRLPFALRCFADLRAGDVLVVDGYEQLNRWNRLRLRRECRRRKLGLVVTSHVSVGLPDLCRTVAGRDLAVRVVRRLMGERTPSPTDDGIAALLARREGNLREVLFDLYDWYEQKRPGG